MIEGQIVLVPFPYIESDEIKLRPAVLLKQLPNTYENWLLCMITTKLHQEIKDLGNISVERLGNIKTKLINWINPSHKIT